MDIKIYPFRDCVDSYGYWSKTGEEIFTDEKGKKYREETIVKEVPCSCHPETCCHLDGKKTITYKERIYIKSKN